MLEYLAGVFDAKARFFEKRGVFKVTLNLRDTDYLIWIYEKFCSGELIKNKKTSSIIWRQEQIYPLEQLPLRLKDRQVKNICGFLKADLDVFTRRKVLQDVRKSLKTKYSFSSTPPLPYMAGFFDVSMCVTFVKYKPRINVICSRKDLLETFQQILGAGSIYRLSKTYNLTFYHSGEVFNFVQLFYPLVHCKKKHFSILYDLFADLIAADEAKSLISRLNSTV